MPVAIHFTLSLRVFFKHFTRLLLLCLLASLTTFGQSGPPAGKRMGSQILDDSTKNVYGPNTSLWTTEQELFENRANYRPIDTTIANYHRWTYVQMFNNYYKDLGIMGTALNSIFPQAPDAIGVSPGYSAYEPYYRTEEIKYFDTKSPYSRVYLVWGGKGRATTRVEFSRNITPRWNFGFNYRPILVDKQIQRNGKGDRQTISQYYDIYTAYRTKDEKYAFLINYRRIRHRVNENGGVKVKVPPDSTYASLFDPNVTPRLTTATSYEQRNNIHLFQQYKAGSGLQVYHKLDLGRQMNVYHDDKSVDGTYYPHFEEDLGKDSIKTKDSVRFNYLINELGVKGNAGKKLFYNFYYKFRQYHFLYKYLGGDSLHLAPKSVEHYLGARIIYNYDSANSITGWAEYLKDGHYRIEGQLRTVLLDVTVKQLLSKPGFVQNAYRGSYSYWNNDFKSVGFSQGSAFLKANFGPLFLSPGATYTLLNNYIYYRQSIFEGTNQTVMPVQSTGHQELFSPEVRMDLRLFRHLHLRPQVIYSTFFQNDDDALRVPKWFANFQIAYENFMFKRNILVQMGVDVHWKSDYTALGYDPAIQQFYVQDAVTSPAFALADVFLNGQIKRGRFFVRYHNLMQLITKQGYLPTPGYPGQQNLIDFGFDLFLFD